MTPREENPRGQSGLRRKALVLFCALALVALLVGAVFGDNGFLRVVEQRQRTRLLQEQVEGLRGENARLADEIRALRSDPRAIERLAREQLGLARAGETVFVLPEREVVVPARP